MRESSGEKGIESLRGFAGRVDKSFEEDRRHLLDLGVADNL
jgi:hypothetical protein